MLSKEEFDSLQKREQDEVLKRGQYFLYLYPRTEYYFRKYAGMKQRAPADAASVEPEKPVFASTQEMRSEAYKLYKAQVAEANELIDALAFKPSSTSSNYILPLRSTLRRWALASAKILLTKPFIHSWNEKVEKEMLGWEIGERRMPEFFGISLPYTISNSLPYSLKEHKEELEECLKALVNHLDLVKNGGNGESILLKAKQKLSEGERRVLTF